MRTLLLVSLGLVACSQPARRSEPQVGRANTPSPSPSPSASAHGSGRDRWRGGGVYLDGDPVGVLRFAELPAGLEPIWETQRQRLPFKAGEAIQYKETKVRRYRVTDYLAALGVKVADISEIHIHGARNTAIVLTRKDLQQHPDDILFKFAGETFGKPVPLIRNVKVGTSFDDLSALTIYMKRTPPTLTADQTLELDGHEVHGIPYHGEPLREGIRVYVDDRLVTMLKRNQLATSPRWKLGEVLASNGVAPERLARLELIHDETRTAAQPWRDVAFAFHEGASGEIVIGDDARPANAIALYTQTHH